MPDATQPYSQTVSRLRRVSARHARVLDGMIGNPTVPGLVQASFEQLERLAEDARLLEDEAIVAVSRLSRLTSRADAERAVEEAGAGWLNEVILNRAAETAHGRGRLRETAARSAG